MLRHFANGEASPFEPTDAMRGERADMWFYIFSENDRYPDPVHEITALAELESRGQPAFLMLSDRADAPLKSAREGERIYLCTREQAGWRIWGQAHITDPSFRGPTPEPVRAIYGHANGGAHWWRRLVGLELFDPPKDEKALGLDAGTLPQTGQAFVFHVTSPVDESSTDAGSQQRTPGALERLSDVMDRSWDAGGWTSERLEESIKDIRLKHRPHN